MRGDGLRLEYQQGQSAEGDVVVSMIEISINKTHELRCSFHGKRVFLIVSVPESTDKTRQCIPASLCCTLFTATLWSYAGLESENRITRSNKNSNTYAKID